MFQSYENIADPSLANSRVAALRSVLQGQKGEGGLAGFLVPRADEFLGEYVPPHAERLYWLSGFSGSAGLALVLREHAAMFVDGRYKLQVREQVDRDLFEICQIPQDKVTDWLLKHLNEGDKLGYDPRLHAGGQIAAMNAALQKSDIQLVPVGQNLVDAIWHDQPPFPCGRVELHPMEYAGQEVLEKLARLSEGLENARQEWALLSDADSVSWLFNIRGADIPHTPAVLATALIPASLSKKNRPKLYIAAEKLSDAVRATLSQNAELRSPETLEADLKALGVVAAKVQLDPANSSAWFTQVLEGGGAVLSKAPDPCTLPKAIKNQVEISGSRAAHLRDGVAVTRFLAWLDGQTQEAKKGEPTGIDEISASQKLEGFRADTGALRDISFDTISGAGANGAIVHYRVSTFSNAPLCSGDLFLIDSGGQYRDGTTDITRTVPIGTPSDEMRRHATLVLKGHIAIASARFPAGTRGIDLDPFARAALWAAGLDFDHGTGHGVGSYLSVHEGPQSISKRGQTALQPGMIISNEPGFYKEGAYGIRIENLVLVEEATPITGGDRDMLGFETLTLAPIDTRLLDVSLLTSAEISWLDAYHLRVHDALIAQLDAPTGAWLKARTAPVERYTAPRVA